MFRPAVALAAQLTARRPGNIRGGVIGYAETASPQKHNPWQTFTEATSPCSADFNAFPTDFTQLPSLAFAIPNLNNDMHDGSIANADAWLRTYMDAYVQWAKANNSLFVLTWDEDDYSASNNIPFICVGAGVRPGAVYADPFNHYSLLRYLQNAFGCDYLASSASAVAIPLSPIQPDHVVVCIMENHALNEIVGDATDAPYMNALAAQGALWTNFFGVTHPSEPNYLALFSGSTQGVTDDNTYSFGAATLAGQLRTSRPYNTNRPYVTGPFVAGQQLAGSAGQWTAGAALSYQWLRNGAPIAGATSLGYTPVAADVGAALALQVTGWDANRSVFSVATSAATPAIAAAGAPLCSAAPAISGTATAGSALSCSTGTWSGSPTSYTYQWVRDGSPIAAGGLPIPGATSSSYTLQEEDSYSYVKCLVTAVGASGSSAAYSGVSSQIAFNGVGPVNTALPTISGTTTAGNTLTCSQGSWNNSPTVYFYQWYENGTALSGQTNSTYALTNADVGSTLTCAVTAKNGVDTQTVSTAKTATILASTATTPVNSAAPTISGTPTQGQTLTASNGTWSNSPTSYAYQWISGGSAVSGATSSSYTLQASDVGAVITVAVTATNSAGSASATSTGTSRVAAANALAQLTLSPGKATVGQAYSGTISGATQGSTITATSSDETKLTVSGVTVTGTFAAASSSTIQLVETLSGASNSPNSSQVDMVIQNPTLGALSLSSTSATANAAWSATISGQTPGSTVAASSSDGTSLTVSGSTVSGTFTAAGSPTVTLTETLSNATNSPKSSTASVTVAAGGYSYKNAEAAAYTKRWTTAPTNAQAQLVDNLFGTLKSDGTYGLLDWLHLAAGPYAQSAVLDIKGNYDGTLTGSPVFTANAGYSGNGSTSNYITTGYERDQATSSKKGASVGNESMFIWTLDTAMASPGEYMIGSADENAYLSRTAATTIHTRPFSSTSTNCATAGNNSGLLVLSRTSSSAVSFYHGNVSGDTVAISGASATATAPGTSTSITYCGDPTDARPSATQVAAAGMGQALAASNVATLYSALNTYLKGVGVTVGTS